MVDKIRWGILGTGRIARLFAEGLGALPDAELVAVGSRAHESAEAFGAQYDVPHRHPTYEALVADRDVDVIYISTPHAFHAANSLLSLEAGKAVLCEKPFALSEAQARPVVEKARQKGLFLMEAMWTRFLPSFVQIRDLIAQGTIGEPRMVIADFGFHAIFDPTSRFYNRELGGGSLLDLGIYPIALAFMLFGAPSLIESTAKIGVTGVDEQAAIIFSYKGGQSASISCAINTYTPVQATITGTDGYIYVPPRFHRASRYVIFRQGEPEKHVDAPFVGNGYNYEAAEVMRCMREGKTESPIMSLDETLSIVRTLDALRASWGLKYPGE